MSRISYPSENRILKYALAVSLLIHAGLFLYFSLAYRQRINRPLKRIEVLYQVVPVTTSKKIVPKEESTTVLGKKISPPAENFIRHDPAKLSPVKDPVQARQRPSLYDKKSAKPDVLDGPRKISVPLVKSEKIKNPVYLGYYDIVRSKIKEQAYRNYREGSDLGKVYVTFILNSSGGLKEIQIIEDKTTANERLRQIGLKSVRDAGPFPIFPKDLNYPELSFNVIISFEVSGEGQ